jgi:uncharacterized sulfatase
MGFSTSINELVYGHLKKRKQMRIPHTTTAIITCFVTLLTYTSQGAVRTWDSTGSGNWNTAGNWSDDTKPGVGDKVLFDTTSTNAGWGGSLNIGNGSKTIGDGDRSFHVDGIAMTLFDSSTSGDLTIDPNSDVANDCLLVSGGASLQANPPNLNLFLANSAAAGNKFGKTSMSTTNGTLVYSSKLTLQTPVTLKALAANDLIAFSGATIELNAGAGLWVAPVAGTNRWENTTFAGSGGTFIEIADDLIIDACQISNSVDRTGITGSNTVVTLLGNANILSDIDTLDTAGLPQGPRTIDLTSCLEITPSMLSLDDAETLHIDFSDPASNRLEFANSSSRSWHPAATLNLIGFNPSNDSLRFSTASDGLTGQQLSQISIDGLSSTNNFLNVDGYLNQGVAPTNPPVTTNGPNVIIILTDDHGYTDLGLHGIDANVQTPTLDNLAANGALMLHGYATAPQCVPSRTGLMAGRIQNTFGSRDNGTGGVPLTVPTIAERIKAGSTYATGMVGKWHAGIFPGDRGFEDFYEGSVNDYVHNFDLDGNTIPKTEYRDTAVNRVTLQGQAAEAFIERHNDEPFFLYLALFGPHTPLLKNSDSYYQNFPVMSYPSYNPVNRTELEDRRRRGLALVKAVDDAVLGVMNKLQALGLEENTLIMFAGDNGAQPKFWKEVGGSGTANAWNGSENVPLRGEKGSLWEGGIKVPTFAYWKNHIIPGQIIDEPTWTLDFVATLHQLALGTIPPEFDGADLLPRLTGEASQIVRTKDMFWDFENEIAMRRGDWKFHRIADHKSLFNLRNDPNELYDLKDQLPEKFAEMEAAMMAWYNALPPEGQSPLKDNQYPDLYITGAPAGTLADPRVPTSYVDPTPAPYPRPLVDAPLNLDSDGDGIIDGHEGIAGTSAADPASLFSLSTTHGGTIDWQGIANRRYTVWHTPDLTSNGWTAVTNTEILATDQSLQFDMLPVQTSGFYRVEVAE